MAVCFEEMGVQEYLGIDGDYLDDKIIEIATEKFLPFDLRKPLQIDRNFELVISLEVAEHLPPNYAETFIGSLTRHGPVVLFSAAIPSQEGENHLNEQWPQYWVQIFRKQGFLVTDCLRKRIWNNGNIKPWYRQNLLIFVRKHMVHRYPLLEREIRNTDDSYLALIHPKIYRRSSYHTVPETSLIGGGTVHRVLIEITEPIPNVTPPAPVEYLHCLAEIQGQPIGELSLPVCAARVSSNVLADAIAAEFFWPIIGHFFLRGCDTSP